jgi:Methyltransferase domain
VLARAPAQSFDHRRTLTVTQPELVRVFDSQGEDYKRAFQVFLDHTDQKRNAKRVLQGIVDGLPARRVFIDAGAGNGEVTRAFAGAFDRTIAIEPNAYLLTQLQRAIPQADAIGTSILTANPEALGDFVLCSHTLYYIPAKEWLAHLERLVSWMSPTGVTVVVLQNRGTACMAMLEHFFGHRFDLGGLVDAFRSTHGDRYDVNTTLDPAHVETSERAAAYTVAEFMLNLLPISRPPARRDLEAYVSKYFATSDGTYRLSVHQDFLQIRARQ